MADSKTELGSVPEFPLFPNWATLPSATIKMARKLFAYPGSSQLLETLTDDVPIRLDMGFTPMDLSDRYDLLDFFCARQGRFSKFWIEWPRTMFTLNRDHENGETTLDCYTNLSDLQIQSYERIRILMNDGDVVIRKIIGITGDGEVNLTLDTSLDRDIPMDGYVRITRLLLCRFDHDKFDWESITDVQGNVAMSFVELVTEYADV